MSVYRHWLALSCFFAMGAPLIGCSGDTTEPCAGSGVDSSSGVALSTSASSSDGSGGAAPGSSSNGSASSGGAIDLGESFLYDFERGPGKFAAVVGSTTFVDTGDIAVGLPNCSVNDVLSISFDANLSADLAVGHVADVKLVAIEANGAGSTDVIGGLYIASVAGKAPMHIAAIHRTISDGDCQIKVSARVPQNVGADSLAIEGPVILKVQRTRHP